MFLPREEVLANMEWRESGSFDTLRRSSLAVLPAALLLAGCANPGPPKPPTLHLPQPAKALVAERIGNRVILSWQTSPETTDGQALNGAITAQICRDDSPKAPPAAPVFPTPPDPCKVVHEQAVVPSTPTAPTEVVDDLPDALTAGEPRLMAYRVTLLNARGRSAGPSAPVYTLAGTAPAAVGPIVVTPRRGGALIQWKSGSETLAVPMQLTRTLVANASGPVEPARSKKAGSRSVGPMRPSTAATSQEVTLTPQGEKLSDPGGMVDHGIHDGDTLRYRAQRVRAVELTPPPAMVLGKKGKMAETKPDAKAFELKSEPSPEVTFTFHDVIPPAAPTGLAELTGGGFNEPLSIDLSWEPSAELDLSGYNVYRAMLTAGAEPHFDRLNAALVLGPEYRDPTAEPGKTYLYRVTAVDQHHNESASSAALKAALRR